MESDYSDTDWPELIDSESEVDSDTETTVPMDDDFLSIEEDDPTCCSICEIWVNGDPDHEHAFRITQERCGLLCTHPDCDGEQQCNHWRYHKSECICEEHMESYQCHCTCGCVNEEGEYFDHYDQNVANWLAIAAAA